MSPGWFDGRSGARRWTSWARERAERGSTITDERVGAGVAAVSGRTRRTEARAGPRVSSLFRVKIAFLARKIARARSEGVLECVREPELTRCFPRGRSSADPDRATRLPFAFDSGHARTMRTSCASRDSDPRDNTDLALVNSGYSKTKLVAAARVCHFRSLYSQSDSSPVPIGDSRRPNGTSSTPHRIGEISPNRNIRMGILCV